MKNILNVRWRPWTSCYCRNLDQKEWRVQFVKYLQLNSISFFISFFVTAKLVEVVFKIWFPSRHWWRHLWTSPIVACCCYIGKIRPLSVAQYLISVKLFLRLLICSNTTPPPSLRLTHSSKKSPFSKDWQNSFCDKSSVAEENGPTPSSSPPSASLLSSLSFSTMTDWQMNCLVNWRDVRRRLVWADRWLVRHH